MKSSEASQCAFCGGSLFACWSAVDSGGHAWDYLRCGKCDLIQLSIPSKEEWKRLAYADDYYGGEFSKFTGAVQELRAFSARRRAREIHRMTGCPGRVLDVGCGEGLFLKAMRDLRWEVEGCEVGERAASRAEKLTGGPIHRGDFQSMKSSGGWNVIMLWHVLEHVEEPAALLRQLGERAAPGAWLVVAVPNAASWQARCFGPSWFHLDPPRHLFSMNVEHVRTLAARGGWNVRDVRHFSLEYNPYGWAQSLLNACGFRRDAMYETLKSGSKKRSLWRVAAWTLLGPSIIPAVCESAFRVGGTTVLYLKKNP